MCAGVSAAKMDSCEGEAEFLWKWAGLAGVVGDSGDLVTKGICVESSNRPRRENRKTHESWLLQRAAGCSG